MICTTILIMSEEEYNDTKNFDIIAAADMVIKKKIVKKGLIESDVFEVVKSKHTYTGTLICTSHIDLLKKIANEL